MEAFEFCQMSSQKIFTFAEGYGYIPLKFADFSDQITNQILWDLSKEIWQWRFTSARKYSPLASRPGLSVK